MDSKFKPPKNPYQKGIVPVGCVCYNKAHHKQGVRSLYFQLILKTLFVKIKLISSTFEQQFISCNRRPFTINYLTQECQVFINQDIF